MRCLSEQGDLREAAANFFRMLRELDAENLDLIVAERVPEEGIGAAINDRLERTSTRPLPNIESRRQAHTVIPSRADGEGLPLRRR